MTHQHHYTPLLKPIPIKDQQWPAGTRPVVATRTLTYNHENYIKDCLDGILMQETTFPVRIVIFEDCSTDNTAAIVKEYQAKYPHLITTFCQPENTYQKPIRAAALQPFLDACNEAPYVAMCEGDDYWTAPNKIQKQVDFLNAHPDYIMCFHNAYMKYCDEEGVDRPFGKLETREYVGDEILIHWTVPTASVVFRSAYQAYPQHEDILYGDIFLFLTLALQGKLFCLNEMMSVYRRHQGGATILQEKDDKREEKSDKHYQALRQAFNGRFTNAIDKRYSLEYLIRARGALKNLNPEAIKCLIDSYKTYPDQHYINFFLNNFLRKDY